MVNLVCNTTLEDLISECHQLATLAPNGSDAHFLGMTKALTMDCSI